MSKKLFSSLVLSALILSLLPIGIPTAQAQQTPEDIGVNRDLSGNPVNTPSQQISAEQKAAQEKAAKDGVGCSITSGLGFSICITNIVYVFTVGLGSAFAYVAAFFLDLAIQLSLQSTAYALDFISTGWTLARDLANMAFIFILIYIALVVLFKAETGDTMRNLIWVVVMALLINFSFFFTRVVIDAGNLVAIQFYNAIEAPTIGETAAKSALNTPTSWTSNFTAIASGGQTKDLTHSIMNMLKLPNLFSTASFQQYAKSDNAGFLSGLISLSFLYIAAGMLFWGLIAVFISAGVKFIFRIVVLWFLIISSPLAFIMKAVPKQSGWFDTWLSYLIKHSIYPAVFLFIFYILTKFTAEMGNNDGLINGVFNGIADSPNYIQGIAMAIANTAIRLGFVIAVLYIAIRAAESVATIGEGAARAAGSWAGGRFIASAAYTSGGLLRNTAGRGFGALARNPTLVAEGEKKIGAAAILGASRWLGSRTYDVRNLQGTGKLKDAIGKTTKITPEAGTAETKGFAAKAKEASEKAEKEKKERAAIIRDAANKKAIERIVADMKKSGTADAADEGRVRNFNKREMEKLGSGQVKDIAHLLSESQLKAEMDSDRHTDASKDAIRDIAEPIIKAQKEVADNLRKASNALRVSATPTLQAHTVKGATISLADIPILHTEVNAQKQALRNYIQANPGQNHGERNADLTQLHNMTNSLNELQKQITKIQSVGARAGQIHQVT